MDDEDRYSASSGELDRDNDNDNDEVMDDAEEDNDNNNEEDDGDGDENENDDDDGENDGDGEGDADADADQEGSENEDDGEPEDGAEHGRAAPESQSQSQLPARSGSQAQSQSPPQQEKEAGDADKEAPAAATAAKPPGSRRPSVRPEAVAARLYDIVPTMAAPQATHVNAMAITPDLRYWFTGGSDGYIRKYDGPGTINGKLPLTVAQRHPFVDSVTKAGILMSYWENEEPSAPGRGETEQVLSPVYSLAVHSEALWLLSGLESGGINLQSVRHDEGKKICCLQQHTNAVSVLTLAQDEKSVLSGSWDKNILDWDLNTGQVKRSFLGTGGQISALELRPASGDPIPAGADELPPSSTISTNNGKPPTNGFTNGAINGSGTGTADGNEGAASPAHESLFGGSDAGSLFGETAGEQQPFGHDEDDYNGSMNMMSGHEHEGGMDHSADMAMAGIDEGATKSTGNETSLALQPPVTSDAMDIDKPEPGADVKPTISAPSPLNGTLSTERKPSPEHAGPTQESKPIVKDTKDEGASGGGIDLDTSASYAAAFSPSAVSAQNSDPGQTSPNVFLAAAMDGTVRLWDRRVQNPVARIGNRPGVPPWCMSACWSPDGNMIFAGRRNGTVEEFDVRKAKRGWEPERVLRFPAGSGAVTALKPMVNGRHLVW
jgi:transcriptional activator SPT8